MFVDVKNIGGPHETHSAKSAKAGRGRAEPKTAGIVVIRIEVVVISVVRIAACNQTAHYTCLFVDNVQSSSSFTFISRISKYSIRSCDFCFIAF